MEEDPTPLQQIIAAGSGAVVTSLFVTPLDVVKIRMQSQKTNMKCFMYCNGLMDHMCYCLIGNGNGKRKWYKRPSSFNSTFHGMVQIARKEGATSLWSGLSPTLVMAVPATVMYFTAYDWLRDFFVQRKLLSKYYSPVVAGAVARAFTVTIISPLELIRTKMQSKKLSSQQIKSAVISTVKAEGLSSMWIGLGPTLMRDIPFSMLYWYLLEHLKRNIEISSVFLKSFTCGLLAGLVCGIVTLPLDVVKTKRQITLGEMELLGMSKRDGTTTYSVMRKIIQESGFRGLFVGIIPRCAKIAPACAIMIGSYDLGKNFFRKRNETKRSNKSSLDPSLESPFNNISSTLHNSRNG